jgi:hypothetical protein
MNLFFLITILFLVVRLLYVQSSINSLVNYNFQLRRKITELEKNINFLEEDKKIRDIELNDFHEKERRISKIQEALPEMQYNDIRYLVNKDINNELPIPIDEILALIHLESRGKVDAQSSKSSAYGYGQFIKSTGRWVANQIGLEDYTHGNVCGKDQIDMICYYISYLKERYPDSYLIRYNGGELGDKYAKIIQQRKNLFTFN